MGSCVSNGKDIIEMRTNNLNNNFKHPYNIKNNKKYKSVQLSSYKINNCPDIKKSKKSLPTYLGDIPGMLSISDVKDNVSERVKLQDALIVLQKINGPMDLVFLIKERLKKNNKK